MANSDTADRLAEFDCSLKALLAALANGKDTDKAVAYMSQHIDGAAGLTLTSAQSESLASAVTLTMGDVTKSLSALPVFNPFAEQVLDLWSKATEINPASWHCKAYELYRCSQSLMHRKFDILDTDDGSSEFACSGFVRDFEALVVRVNTKVMDIREATATHLPEHLQELLDTVASIVAACTLVTEKMQTVAIDSARAHFENAFGELKKAPGADPGGPRWYAKLAEDVLYDDAVMGAKPRRRERRLRAGAMLRSRWVPQKPKFLVMGPERDAWLPLVGYRPPHSNSPRPPAGRG